MHRPPMWSICIPPFLHISIADRNDENGIFMFQVPSLHTAGNSDIYFLEKIN